MKPIYGVTIVLFLAQLLLPVDASAQAVNRNEGSSTAAQFELPSPVFADAAQSGAAQLRPSKGGRMLRNALMGAAIGGTLGAVIARSVGDCGNCGSDTANAILSGAMYGAFAGLTIGVHPSLGPSASQLPRQPVISAKVTKQVKAVSVAVRF